MKRRNANRNALFTSIISLLLCVSMLVGTTFAWFTDSVVTGINTIAAGNLDVELYHTNAVAKDEKVEPSTDLFRDLQGDPILWEPGVVSYENLRVVNEGSLALAYQMAINTANENYVLDPSGAQYGLSQILKVGVVEDGITATDRAGVVASVAEGSWTTLADFLRNGSLLPEDGENEKTWGIVIYWEPGENDNLWNLNNGKTLSEGEELQIDLGISLIATQEQYESDAFGSDYDGEAKAAVFPEFAGGTADADVAVDGENLTTAEVTMTSGAVSAVVPAGVKVAAGASKLTLTVTPMDASGANISLGDNEDMRSLDVHIEGVDPANTTPIVVTLKEVAPTGLNMGNYKLYHVEKGATNEMTLVDSAADFTAHNQFKYDPATGDIVLYMATFSEVTVVADLVKAWEGKFDYSWYDANAEVLTIANADQLAAFGAIVGGMKKVTDRVDNKYTYSDDVIQDSFKDKTVKLISDINLGDAEGSENAFIFYPIGYWNDEGTYEKSNKAISSGFYTFEGTFDGQGHTIANFYQNTWEMKGDHDWYSPEEQYYRDGMGLFGKVYGGTVKNLTINNFKSDGEITTTGCVAAYADGATFENIAIFNCNPRVYNIGNGGIVGCVGWYAKDANLKTTFKNITVDNSNKISALWGSYDVACGGIVGQYYPTSGQTSAGTPKNAGIDLVNCHVAAQMDVYNDVCGNYQYYAYRYAGMMIGSIRENTTTVIDGVTKTIPDMTGISATGCTVNYGDWNDYYYCEFEKNGHPSYSGPNDYKFSRVPDSELNFTDSNGNGKVDADERASVTGCKHDHTAAEDNKAIYLPFHQLFTGYGWGVNSIGLEKYSGITVKEFGLDIGEGENESSVDKFAAKADINLSTINAGDSVSVEALFTATGSDVEIKNDAVVVSVTDLTNTGVTADFTRGDTWDKGTLKFNGTNGLVKITIQDYYFCNPASVIVEVGDFQTTDRFAKKFNNESFTYRVGNQNDFKVGNLIGLASGVTTEDIGDITVTVTAKNGGELEVVTADASSWDADKIQFAKDFNGLVTVTITDDNYSTPVELELEVVEATNVTTATSATSNSVVLLNNCGFSSLEVSGGYTLYGNGFTMTCASDSAALDMGYSFVTLNNGTLDNVQIVCPNFDYAALYKSNLTSSDNRSETDTSGKTRYYNAKSGVMVSGNSQILNSRISGGRAAVNVSSGNVIIDNSRIELGAVASILVGAANKVTLRDVTLVQKPTASTYDSSKSLMGFSVLMICNSDGDAAPITLEGNLIQNAWADENDKQYVPSAGASIVETVLKQTDFLHDLDDNGINESVNLGFAYMPESLTSSVNTATITDNRTNKDAIPYGYAEVTIMSGKTYVYSYKNTNGTDADIKEEDAYAPDSYGDIITVIYSDTADGLTTSKSYGSDGWTYELNVDMDKLSSYAFDFSKLSVSINSVPVTDFMVNGSEKPTSPIAVTAGGTTYNLTATVGGKEYTVIYKVTGTETSKEAPSLVASNYGSALLVGEAGDTFNKDTWHGAAPVLDGVSIKYWSVAEKTYKVIDLSDYTPSAEKGKINESNPIWNFTPDNGDFTLTIENLEDYKIHVNNNVRAIPVMFEGTLYFVSAASNGLVNYGNDARTIRIDYTFKDNNGGELKFYNTWSIECANGNTAYDYSDFCNGTNKTFTIKSSNGEGCVTGDTLVTLADGTQKRVDELSFDDKILTWDFFTGDYVEKGISLLVNHGEALYKIANLRFSDGTMLRLIAEHGVFDYDLNKFVYITVDNMQEYVGHRFVKYAADGSYSIVKLIRAYETEEYTSAWSVSSAVNSNAFASGLLTVAPPEDFYNWIEMDGKLRYNAAKFQQDVETYGLYTYDDFKDYVTYEQFVDWNGAYLKIAVEKGYFTFDYILELIELYKGWMPNN